MYVELRGDFAQAENVLFQWAVDSPPSTQPDILHTNGLAIVIPERQATLHGRPLALTSTEVRLLLTLARAPGHLFAYCNLAERVLGWYTCNECEARANLRVHVMRLRRKLRADGCCYDIVAVRGAGYRSSPGSGIPCGSCS